VGDRHAWLIAESLQSREGIANRGWLQSNDEMYVSRISSVTMCNYGDSAHDDEAYFRAIERLNNRFKAG